MDGFDPATSFAGETAQRYDDELRGDETETVEFLARLAGSRPALELAIGTGRVAVPLAERGVEVHGIEISEDMVAQLRAKPHGRDLPVTLGDMSRADAPGSDYALVYLVFNTIHNLLTQDDQVRCYENAARHLAPDGAFVVETGVPEAWLKGRRQFVDAEYVAAGEVVLDVTSYDPVSQVADENHVHLSAAGVRMGPISHRLAYPSEHDLMARIAGLRLVDRWGGWLGEPFTADSERHISVYRF
ncbi:class I SAM-dependent DNA methyltransferase [Nocardioides sp. LHG3406-4]|uniref:class I SAM-dependent DNA methyltransferase n=1 Tax=Nocardioides sp. LHG3406-4 TaxID=2804575 RepID=UPI003CF3A4DC